MHYQVIIWTSDMAIFPDETQKGYGITTSTHKQLHPVQTVFPISKAHNGAHWGLSVLASHVLWTEGRHISVSSSSRPGFFFCFVSTKRWICLTLREPCMAWIEEVYNELCVCGTELAVNVTGGLLSVVSGTKIQQKDKLYIYILWRSRNPEGDTKYGSGRQVYKSFFRRQCNCQRRHSVNMKELSLLIFWKCLPCILDYTLNCAVF